MYSLDRIDIFHVLSNFFSRNFLEKPPVSNVSKKTVRWETALIRADRHDEIIYTFVVAGSCHGSAMTAAGNHKRM
jgi:hypothetical protein